MPLGLGGYGGPVPWPISQLGACARPIGGEEELVLNNIHGANMVVGFKLKSLSNVAPNA